MIRAEAFRLLPSLRSSPSVRSLISLVTRLIVIGHHAVNVSSATRQHERGLRPSWLCGFLLLVRFVVISCSPCAPCHQCASTSDCSAPPRPPGGAATVTASCTMRLCRSQRRRGGRVTETPRQNRPNVSPSIVHPACLPSVYLCT